MTSFQTHRQLFTNLVPELERMATARFLYLREEAREEAVQNAICLTWQNYHVFILKGMADPGIIKSILWFSIKQTRSGRALTRSGNTNAKDASTAAKRGKVKFVRVQLKHFVSDNTPIPDAVSFRVDVPAFFSSLTQRQRSIAEDLMSGMTTTECADKYGLTLGRISQFRTWFKEQFDLFLAD